MATRSSSTACSACTPAHRWRRTWSRWTSIPMRRTRQPPRSNRPTAAPLNHLPHPPKDNRHELLAFFHRQAHLRRGPVHHHLRGGTDLHPEAAGRRISGRGAAVGGGARPVPGRQSQGDRRNRRHAAGAADQRRRQHAVHVVAIDGRRQPDADRDLQDRHQGLAGRDGCAEPRAARLATSVSACETLVPILKVTVSIRLPSAVDCDDMYSMLSTPLICCSSGVATVSAITLGLAPGYWARTTTDGGTTSGYSATGSFRMEISPATKMMMDRTPAKMGLSMKKREKFMAIILWRVRQMI